MDQRKFMFGAVALLLSALTALSSCAKSGDTMSPVERGKYLVMAGGCTDCHSPKRLTPQGPIPDTTRLLSGYPAGSTVPTLPKRLIGPTAWG